MNDWRWWRATPGRFFLGLLAAAIIFAMVILAVVVVIKIFAPVAGALLTIAFLLAILRFLLTGHIAPKRSGGRK